MSKDNALMLFKLQENGDIVTDDGSQRGVQYPFSVNEKVIIKVNTPFFFWKGKYSFVFIDLLLIMAVFHTKCITIYAG